MMRDEVEDEAKFIDLMVSAAKGGGAVTAELIDLVMGAATATSRRTGIILPNMYGIDDYTDVDFGADEKKPENYRNPDHSGGFKDGC